MVEFRLQLGDSPAELSAVPSFLLEGSEALASSLRRVASRSLTVLRLPICSDQSMLEASKMERLQFLMLDVAFNHTRDGLRAFMTSPHMRANLKSLQIGWMPRVVSKLSFNNLDAAKLLQNLPALQSLRVHHGDHDRRPLRRSSKAVQTYSAVKLSLIDAMQGQIDSVPGSAVLESSQSPHRIFRVPFGGDPSPEGQTLQGLAGRPTFQCNLVEICVRDKAVKPNYLLECCPNLKSVTMEWTTTTVDGGFQGQTASAVHFMAKTTTGPSWWKLGSKLAKLELLFPLPYPGRLTDGANNDRRPTSEDFRRLISSCPNLEYLKLARLGTITEAMPLNFVLRHLGRLEYLELEDCHFSCTENESATGNDVFNRVLKSFRYNGAMSQRTLALAVDLSAMVPNLASSDRRFSTV